MSVAVVMCLGVGLAALASPAQAATLTVTSTGDDGDGTCDETHCTLREAIEEADASEEDNVIGFADSVRGTIVLTQGDLTIDSEVQIVGPGADVLTVDADGSSRVFLVTSGTVEISGLTITGGNTSYDGGGIYNFGGTLSVTDTTITGNNTTYHGGGILNGGTLTVDSSTITGNTASGGGGGIYSVTPTGSTTEKTTITNSTISGNSAAAGGGVYNNNGLTEIEHSTITDNYSAPQGWGSGVASVGDSSTTTEVLSSIISANTNIDVDSGASTNSFVSEGHNLIGDGNATGAFDEEGDRTGVDDPRLGGLSNNGGPTPTHALLQGSPAIDAEPSACPPPQTDQRGVQRPQGEACDIGAFELEQEEPPDPQPPQPDNGCTITGTNGDDVLRGTSGRDVICALGGNDTVSGFGANDVIRGSNGRDTIRGGDGNDFIRGNKSRDRLYGNEGNDTIYSGSGRDLVRGGPGRDVTR